MRDAEARLTGNDAAGPKSPASIDALLDQAVDAINRGDRVAGTALAEQVLASDGVNAEAEDLLSAPDNPGEIRRLTILFADLVDSTVLSTRVEPETYRVLVGRYREQVCAAVNRLEGHVGSHHGDGILAVFGHPIAHEDDVRRAVLAGLEITGDVARLSERAQRQFGVGMSVRVGVHRGLVYLDTASDDVYGSAANVAARVCTLASPGTLVVSDVVAAFAQELDRDRPDGAGGADDSNFRTRRQAVHGRAFGEGLGQAAGSAGRLPRLVSLGGPPDGTDAPRPDPIRRCDRGRPDA